MPNHPTSSGSSSSKSNSTTGCFVVGPVPQHAAPQSDEVVRAGELGAPFPVRARPAVRLRGHPPRRHVDLGAVVVGSIKNGCFVSAHRDRSPRTPVAAVTPRPRRGGRLGCGGRVVRRDGSAGPRRVLPSSPPAIPLRRGLTRLPGIIEITPNQSVLPPYDVSMTVTDWIVVV